MKLSLNESSIISFLDLTLCKGRVRAKQPHYLPYFDLVSLPMLVYLYALSL